MLGMDRVTGTRGNVTRGQGGISPLFKFPLVNPPKSLNKNKGEGFFPPCSSPLIFSNNIKTLTRGKNPPPLRGGSIPKILPPAGGGEGSVIAPDRCATLCTMVGKA